MKLLGAILAGGRSTRFGTDKAAALLAGKPLLDHVAECLARQCDDVIVCGRDWPGRVAVADRPGPDLGPLGGLNAALHHAAEQGYDAVLSAGCDTPQLPDDLAARFGSGGYYADLPVIGLWPAALAPDLDRHLAQGGNRAVRRWASRTGLNALSGGATLANINYPDDLKLLRT
ncbi:molybdenum cofactor guanylyltransferase [Sphingosinithalassobacter portus]|uniref:molybdenum cofactor guanylyltransferase n=1 Tax=Stakelama portus TaxID=2676234 RepID=UPI000D6E8025|nr:molybdenum cofactor guanylyltransferase [Sphingosinithalassobacter portus]